MYGKVHSFVLFCEAEVSFLAFKKERMGSKKRLSILFLVIGMKQFFYNIVLFST